MVGVFICVIYCVCDLVFGYSCRRGCICGEKIEENRDEIEKVWDCFGYFVLVFYVRNVEDSGEIYEERGWDEDNGFGLYGGRV